MKTARLLYSCDADWFYATRLPVSDPAAWCQTTDGQTHACISPLEFGLVQTTQHKVDNIHPFPTHMEAPAGLPPQLNQFHYLLSQADWPDRLEVPANFPAHLFALMQTVGWPVAVVNDPFFPQRPFKTKEEIDALRQAQQVNEQGMAHLRNILAEATIGPQDLLFWQDRPLTSETLKEELAIFLFRHGCTDFGGGPIIACGAQAAIPHERGQGPLFAHQFIIIDTFPRHENHYYGDLTRTYLKGTPTPWHEEVYSTVLAAQQAGLHALGPTTTGDAVHQTVAETIAAQGFETGRQENGTPYGFCHSTGHHVGLEVHDVGGRLLSPNGPALQAGIVTSVEPGLYYPPGTHAHGVGGCRIEDVAVITDDGYENLTTIPTDDWIID